MNLIYNYNDFVEALLDVGFSMGTGRGDGIYAIVTWGWREQPPYETPVAWHTECPDTDPWEWRMRVLEERNDIAYAKVFFKKTGFITKEWYPYFLAARRGTVSFEEVYMDGKISHAAKRVYDVVSQHGSLPSHSIKSLAGFAKEEKNIFERALVELQMKMFVTTCGRQQQSHMASSMFCTVERFFKENDLPTELGFFESDDDVFKKAAAIGKDEAIEKITRQVLKLNPQAEQKKILKFILG